MEYTFIMRLNTIRKEVNHILYQIKTSRNSFPVAYRKALAMYVTMLDGDVDDVISIHLKQKITRDPKTGTAKMIDFEREN